MASKQKSAATAMEIDRLATQLAKDPHSKAFLPLAEEYCKADMWEEAVSVLEEGLKHYPGFITAMVALGRAYDQLNQPTKARAVLEGAVKLSPENLRAHRTLIKIYTAQGLTDPALQSCNVILAMNPKDEEALSVRASLGVLSQAAPENQSLSASIQVNAPEPESQQLFTRSTDPMQARVDEPAATAESVLCVKETPRPTSPINLAASIIETTLQENHRRPVEKQATAAPQPEQSDSPAVRSSHAGTIAQLESWLRSIERQRRDRVTSGDCGS